MILVLCTSSDNALYLHQVSVKYLCRFLSDFVDMISILQFIKGEKFFTKHMWSYGTCSLYTMVMLYICTEIGENI